MRAERVNSLTIRTPEGIRFSQLLAGPVTRLLAWSIDVLCIVVITIVIQTAVSVLALVSFDLAQALSILVFFTVSVGYAMVLEWIWRGQTLGKRLLRLRVVDAQGLRLQFSQIVLRNLIRFVDALPLFYLVGGVACLVTRHAQRLGDIAANTVVIRIPVLAEPDLDQLLAGKYNSLRDHPHLEARLRQRVSPVEARLALQAVLRRDAFDAPARVELFRELAGHFRRKVEFPPEVLEGITDEQYVRNVADLVFRSRGGELRNQEKS